VKDLADVMLLMDLGLPNPPAVRTAVKEIFAARRSHDIPARIDDPPVTWVSSFTAMAQDLQLKETTPDRAVVRLNDYWKELSF